MSRIKEGFCSKIPPSEWLAWKTLTGCEVDYMLMRAMDDAFCNQMNIELEEYRQRNKPKEK